ncbi:mycofactocin-coupled SDR family oxidoreductase [Mycolicibacterium parafortuitum]|uniref:Short-chain dehydrogenase [Modestobacter marinus] n=1 Tax=Mycolicibacterium parafortuitum TaxID=39692 RepID=A0A375YCD1_MYCPF|nr:mycofactocin-coupled SDR family oxidoreductase [Mycolicibacterium parafortuitum]ORB30808.1 3-ketoacyl-ACP reductase [Mycolicibacterium parafortuitum]SRX78761.1 short-chain dehydrogenase [Modestobacter marinus] [Mycolicibacterium parafortuitum]
MNAQRRVAVLTGAARGQGRSHAVALAEQGIDIIAVDRCADIESVPYPLATTADLDETAKLVHEAGADVETVVADVRDLNALQAGIDRGIARFGDVDIVIANAGVVAIGRPDPTDDQLYRDIVDVNLLGVWHTIAATAPSMIRRGTGGSMVLISSMQGLVGRGGDGSAATFAYAASKHGVVGLMRSAANAYAPHNIRVNSIHPTGVATPMIFNEHMAEVFAANPEGSAMSGNLLPVPFVEPSDVSAAVLYLVSDGARYITGTALPVDAGFAVM